VYSVFYKGGCSSFLSLPSMSYKVRVVRDLCIGAASCVALAPLAFELDSEGKAIVKDTVSQTSDAELLESAKSCPVDAIIVEDESGMQIWPQK